MTERSRNRPLTRKVLLVGWDAADWKVIHPLMDAGKMPTLKWLVERGSIGNLASLDPPMSPIMWTSIATGKTADKHGVLGFIQPRPDGKGVQPVLVSSRKTKAMWNILMQQGLRCHVIGWWPSHPAEHLNGVCISNFYHRAHGGYGKPWPLPPGSVHPKELADVMAWLRVHPQELTGAHILPFVPDADRIDPANPEHEHHAKLLTSLTKTTAEAATVHAAATWVMDHEPWDFMAVYFDAVDHYSHGFMKFHPPHRPHISKELYDRWHGVVEGGYRFHDMMLRTLIEKAGPDATILLCSDHGFHPDHLRPTGLPDEPAGPAAEHRQHGVIAMAGPGIARDNLIYGSTLLDICPTVLTLFGLPVGDDMDGKPLVQALDRPVEPEYIDSWDAVEGDSGMIPEEARRDPWAEQEALNQLIELGYVERPDDNAQKAVEDCERETDYYLARVLLHKHDQEGARPLLEKLHRKYPDQSRFGLRLANLYISQERGADARRVVEEVFAAQQQIAESQADEKEREEAQRKLAGSGPQRELLLGQICLAEGDAEEALNHFERVQLALPKYPGLPNELGRTFAKMKRWQDAEEAYFQALDADPHNAAALQGLGMVYVAIRQFREAVEALRECVGLLYHNPAAHFHLGEALFRLGEFEEAERAWLTCINQAPGFKRAHLKLIELYRRHLKAPERALEHQLFVDQKIREADEMAAGNEGPLPETPGDALILGTRTPAPPPAGQGEEIPPEEIVTIVSGLPRSGTSMMMQMLRAGGIEPLTDDHRAADEDNPRGYWEYEPAKALARDSSWLPQAKGKAVKVIAQLLPFLPQGFRYKIIFMERPLQEVLESQTAMLERMGAEAGGRDTLAQTFQRHLDLVQRQLGRRRDVAALYVPYRSVIDRPAAQAEAVATFLGGGFDAARAAAAVDGTLYRRRGTGG